MIVRHLNRVRLFLKLRRNNKENKELIGEDRFGNEYYQTYSSWGLPTKRECDYMDIYSMDEHRDNAYW